ncbi:MAG: ATPase [Clostridia bacterium]|nr:ATPase [Clostridia bacterium]
MAVKKVLSARITGPVDSLDAAAKALISAGCFEPEGTAAGSAADTGYSAALSELCPLLDSPVDDDGDRLPEGEADDAVGIAEGYARRLFSMKERARTTEEQIGKLKESEELLSRFAGADLNVAELEAMEFSAFIPGVLPKAAFDELYFADNGLILVRCEDEGDRTWCAVFSPVGRREEAEKELAVRGFSPVELPHGSTSVRATYESTKKKIAMLEQTSAENGETLRGFLLSEGERIAATVRTLRDGLARQSVIRSADVTADRFTLTGWIPASEKERVKTLLSKVAGVSFSASAPDPSSSPPVIIRNPRIFRPFEFFVRMFGTPSYGEADPTPFVAVTYVLLFGVMFGDLGQGIVVSVVGWLMWRLRKMELGRILIPCGISSAFFGLVFGSVFGFEHVLDPVYRVLFGMEEKPIEVMAPATAGTIIYAAVGVGVALVAAAMLINCFVSARRRDFGGLLFGPNGISGLVFYCAVVWGLVSTVMLGKSPFSVPYIVFLIVLPLVLIYLREPLSALVSGKREKIEWGNYLAQSFFELFESVLSYVTNTMSFLRVGAFVLVHAGMMTVVFTLAGMSSGVVWWIIVAVGNIVVAAIEGLLVGIQVLRLEFYEMFSRFFEGGGRPFTPIGRKKTDV